MGRLHQDDVRAKIQAGQLVKRLQEHALSEGDEEFPLSKMKAIEILLRKSLPDLSAVTINGTGDNGAVVIEIVRFAAHSATK